MKELEIGHTPDVDDAFMFYGLIHGKVVIPEVKLVHVIEDIETLNKWANEERLDVTAVSAAMYPLIQDKYWLTDVGASVGYDYGPLVVSKKFKEFVKGKHIAIPGRFTTANLLLNMYVKDYIPVETNFSQIVEMVKQDEVDYGLLIHEAQLAYSNYQLYKVFDLGEFWYKETSLPLPLGINLIKKRVEKKLAQKIVKGLRESISYALEHKEEAMDYALQYGRGIDKKSALEFVNMYVNNYTLDLGEKGKMGLEELYHRGYERGLLPQCSNLKFIAEV